MSWEGGRENSRYVLGVDQILIMPKGGGGEILIHVYVLGEGAINLYVQGGFLIDVISRGVHLLTGIAQ